MPGTVADQITLWDEAISREQMEAAARMVGLHDTIQALERQGGPSDIAYKNCENTRRALQALGLNFEYEENEQKGHSWGTWRADLYNLAQRIFK